MLHFDRHPLRPAAPHLTLIQGGLAAAEPTRGRTAAPAERAWHPHAAVVLVIAATALAVVIDLADGSPAWSHLAVAGSAFVLAVHRLLRKPA